MTLDQILKLRKELENEYKLLTEQLTRLDIEIANKCKHKHTKEVISVEGYHDEDTLFQEYMTHQIVKCSTCGKVLN